MDICSCIHILNCCEHKVLCRTSQAKSWLGIKEGFMDGCLLSASFPQQKTIYIIQNGGLASNLLSIHSAKEAHNQHYVWCLVKVTHSPNHIVRYDESYTGRYMCKGTSRSLRKRLYCTMNNTETHKITVIKFLNHT